MTIQRLSELRHNGYITDEEYVELKTKLTSTDSRDKMLQLDSIRHKHGISIDDLTLVTREDMIHDVLESKLIDAVEKWASYINCTREMFRLIYDIKDYYDYIRDYEEYMNDRDNENS